MFFVLLFMPRSRFYYYVVVSGLKGALSFQLKLIYAEPRPYQLDHDIVPFKCKATFGNPSGHSMAASVAAIVIFLDIYHGTPVTYKHREDSIYHGWCSYLMSLLFAIYWFFSIPYSRYLGGVHSLDQVVHGSVLGVGLGLFCHFMIRDNLIWFFERVHQWQRTKGFMLSSPQNQEAADMERQ